MLLVLGLVTADVRLCDVGDTRTQLRQVSDDGRH